MNKVTFPLLNLTLNINRIAFSFLGIDVYWYACIIVTAIIIVIITLKIKDGIYGIKFETILDLLLFLIPISLISARIYYIVFNLKYYIINPTQILNFRSGGMAIYGGIIGGIITCAIFCKKKKINFLDLIDYLAPGLVLGQTIGRWGNFVNIEAYGVETTLPWRMGIYEMGKYIEVHPTFFYESLACFIIFIILILIQNKRTFKGEIACIYLMLYSFERIFVEALRTDSLMLGIFKISQLLSVIIFILSFTYYCSKKCRKSLKNINKQYQK